MTITKQYLRKWEENNRKHLTHEQKQMFLERFSEEPYPYEWSAQDIDVQIGNYLYCGEWEKPIQSNSFGEALPHDIDF